MSPEIAFSEIIAPNNPKAQCIIDPPIYATHSGFEFNLNALKSSNNLDNESALRFRPMQLLEPCSDVNNVLETIESKTTLDRGQVRALCEMLSRKLAFTQGPPGTGKL